ncbi:SIR2 family protein [Dyadobacter sp. CY261]|uniref:SIR2 family protein n=1 Tax=Dyadobacter sp. CY261 TaxID=2907203 RepID=UPI001F391128|nr:SIR2 family protein [Dyadobacter sp. CY261]MCF0072221.1 SIR2 family protein [Dyadobacter sp. CY261]
MNFTHQQESFLKDYLKKIINGEAAIFAGAGLSVGAGFVDWRQLLKNIAEEIELEVDKEYDLISLAQFHVNEKGGRGRINQTIIEEFKENAEISPNHEILARLPIRIFWTTNYDSLIEDALEQASKRVDTKHMVSQLPDTTFKRDAVVYKMHGDAKFPAQAIITKDDYEQYHIKNEAFVTALSSDLISKTFLFIGFSFTDPNLDYILSRVRLFLNENTRPHYCLIKRVDRNDKNIKSDADFEYAKRRQQLMISDLKRFQIEAVMLEAYTDITSLLEELEKRYKRNTVFISGSAAKYTPHSDKSALDFVHGLSKKLIESKYSVVNGFGLGIGDAVINGALEAVYNAPKKYSDSQLIMRPFPQKKTGKKDIPELWREYRVRMISFAGIAIFIFGNKEDKKTGNFIPLADGVREEFDIALSQGVIPIPVGLTGSMAAELWNDVDNRFDEIYEGLGDIKESFLALNDPKTTLGECIQIIVSIINLMNRK